MSEHEIYQPSGLFGMDCGEAVDALLQDLDGDLTDAKRALIEQHLAACEPCGAAASFERELRAVIADRCHERVPESLVTKIAEAINKERNLGS